MRFAPTAFNRHLENIGQQVTWSKSYSCSCFNMTSGTGAPDTRCPHCLGKGHIWTPAKGTVCGLSSQKTQQQWMASGQWTDGDIVVTIPGSSVMWDVGPFDRVAMQNGDERFSLPLTRGAPGERLLFNAKSVERVFWIDKTTKAMVEGGLPTLDPQGRPIWGAGPQPPAGMTYSITGLRRPEYYCLIEMVSSRNEHSGMKLPKRVVLRRFDLLGRRAATA